MWVMSNVHNMASLRVKFHLSIFFFFLEIEYRGRKDGITVNYDPCSVIAWLECMHKLLV